MFSTTKVMTSLLTSLLIFLAIELMEDLLMLPRDNKFTQFVQKLGPSLYRKLLLRGIKNPDQVYDNMMRQLAYESTYGTSRVARELHNCGGYGWNGKTYTTFKNDDLFLDHYLDIMTGRHKDSLLAGNPRLYAESLKRSGYYEDTVDNYARNLAGMQSVSRAASIHRANNPSLYDIDRPYVPLQYIQIKPEVPVSTVVNQVIPAEQTVATWTGAENVSPYVTGKPMLMLLPRVQLPNLIDVVEDSQWNPGYADGKSPIRIKPANRGKLTRLKKRTGKSESELYRTGGPSVRKMITFARNARKWKH